MLLSNCYYSPGHAHFLKCIFSLGFLVSIHLSMLCQAATQVFQGLCVCVLYPRKYKYCEQILFTTSTQNCEHILRAITIYYKHTNTASTYYILRGRVKKRKPAAQPSPEFACRAKKSKTRAGASHGILGTGIPPDAL